VNNMIEKENTLNFLDECIEELKNTSNEEYFMRKKEKKLNFEEAYNDNSFMLEISLSHQMYNSSASISFEENFLKEKKYIDDNFNTISNNIANAA